MTDIKTGIKTGSCLCGSVTYQTSGSLRPVVNCHCRQCRKTSGHHVAATSVLRDHITISGAVTWYGSTPGVKRGFCGTCGSNLFWNTETSPRLSIFAGTFDGDTGLQTLGNIFVADKGDYYDLDQTLPCALASDPKLTTA